MTDSDYEPGSIPDSESEKMTEAKKKALRDLPSKNERYKEPSQLPIWVKTAITEYEMGRHETLADAAEAHGRVKGTFANWRSTPAGKKWIESIRGVADDPHKYAEMLLRENLADFTADLVSMWEMAYETNDYEWLRKMWNDINDRLPHGLSKKGGDSGAMPSIEINLIGGAESESDAEFEVIEADWDEVDED